MKSLAIVGAGGHTRSSVNLLKEYFSNMKITMKIYDSSYNENSKEFIDGILVVGTIEDIQKSDLVFLSIGNNNIRCELYNKFKEQLINDNLFHKTAYIENSVVMGLLNQVYANVYINSYVKIGDNNIINSGAIIEHEVEIGSHNHISVGSRICGRVKIGDNIMVGAGATIIDKVSICNDVIIGAGSVVIDDIKQSGTYVGIPARKIA